MHLTPGNEIKRSNFNFCPASDGTDGQDSVINCFLKMPDQMLFVFESQVSWLTQKRHCNLLFYFYFLPLFFIPLLLAICILRRRRNREKGQVRNEKSSEASSGTFRRLTVKCFCPFWLLVDKTITSSSILVLKQPTIIVFAPETSPIKEHKTRMKTMKTIRFRNQFLVKFFFRRKTETIWDSNS